MKKTNETSDKENHVQRLYSGRYNSYAEWNGSAWEDKSVSGAYFYSLEKAANNGYYPIVNLRRDEALEWWRKLDYNTQEYFKKKYNKKVFGDYNKVEVIQEIQQIWLDETQSTIPSLSDEEDTFDNGSELYEGKSIISKPNQKQFKEFNPELFKAYIDKFSDDHKFNMFLVLLREFKLESSVESNIMTLVALKDVE